MDEPGNAVRPSSGGMLRDRDGSLSPPRDDQLAQMDPPLAGTVASVGASKSRSQARGGPLQAWAPTVIPGTASPGMETNGINGAINGINGIIKPSMEVAQYRDPRDYRDQPQHFPPERQTTQSVLSGKMSRLAQSEMHAYRIAERLGKSEAWKAQLNEMKVIHDQCALKQRAYYWKQKNCKWLYHVNAFFTLVLILASAGLSLAKESVEDFLDENASSIAAASAFAAGVLFYMEKYLQWAQKVERYTTAAARTVALLSDLENAIMNFCSRVSLADAASVDEELHLAARDCDRYRGALKAIELEYPLTYGGKRLEDEI